MASQFIHITLPDGTRKQVPAGCTVREALTPEGGRLDGKVLAAKLGVAPEVLSRSFAALISCGVAVDGRDIRISDNEMLRRCARPAVGEAVA